MTASMATGTDLPSITIGTVNSARDSKGSIHDDEKAWEMGYASGFVPGVTIFGYMLRLMHEQFGDDWLTTGTFTGRLRRPTYACVDATVEGSIVESPSPENGGRVSVELRVRDPEDAVTANGTATCRLSAESTTVE